jgi:cell division protein ZapD
LLHNSRSPPFSLVHSLLIVYEYPLNERIRTLLRLEDLFAKLEYFMARDDALDHHVALTTIFEILEVSRSDLKSDLLQELERQKQSLSAFKNNPSVSSQALERVLAEIDLIADELNTSASGKIGQYLRDNDWLMSIRSRTIIPGGACEFDLPSYYAWQHRPLAQRRASLQQWSAGFIPLTKALNIVLRLLRDSGQSSSQLAQQGSFQQVLNGKPAHMLQIQIDPASGAIPEISANKYMLWVRFTSQDGDLRPKPFEGDIPFELALCTL